MSGQYRTALDYWRDQAEQASGGGLWSLAEAVGDALDLSGHGNDGTVTYTEGQRGVDGLYDRSDGAMRFEEGTVNLVVKNLGTDPIGSATLLNAPTREDLGDGWYRLTGTGANGICRLYCLASDLVNGETYTPSVYFRNATGAWSIDWCDVTGTNTDVDVGGGVTRRSRPAARSTYDSTYRFMDIQIPSGVSVEVRWPQVEHKTRATSYVGESGGVRVASAVNLGSGDELDDIFDGGGALAALIVPDSAGQTNNARIADKGQWALQVASQSGGATRLGFIRAYSGDNGNWTTTSYLLQFGVPYAVVLLFNDADGVAANPTLHVANLQTGATQVLTVGNGITENTTPTGTPDTDASSSLYIGNHSSGVVTFDGVIDLVRVWQGTQPTEGQIARFFRLALVAELVPLAPARVYLHDGSFRRIGQLTTATSVNRSYRMDRPGQANVTIAVDDPLIGETSPLAGRVLVVESAAYPVPWAGKIVRRRGNRRAGTVTLEAESFDAILEERVLPTGFATTGSAGAEMARVLATVNGRNPTGIGVGTIQNHIVPIAGMSFPEWTARRALDAIGAQSGLEWWLDYEVATENIEILFRAARSRGFNRYRSVSLVDGGNCTWEDWTEEGKATTFALTVVAGQTSVTESYTERTRTTQIVESGGGFVTTFEQVAAGGGGQTSTPGGNTGSQSIEYGGGAHGFVTVAQTVRTPITRRERSVVREELKTRDVTVQSAQALLRQRRLSEQVITVTHLDASGWGDLELGSVVRLVAPGAFADGFDGPARILGVQPMEELGECDLVLELLHDPEAA